MSAPSVGVFGGSFDPVHFAHLRVAEEAREELSLDRVLFVPACHPPHKPDRELAPADLRYRMVELAVASNPAFEACSIDLDRGGVSFSVDLLEEIARREPGAEITFLLGEDAFLEIPSWRDFERLFELAHIAVLSRPTAVDRRSIEHLPVAARNRFCYQEDTERYRHSSGKVLRFLAVTALDISATEVRQRIREGRSVRYLVPASVETFLRSHAVYAET